MRRWSVGLIDNSTSKTISALEHSKRYNSKLTVHGGFMQNREINHLWESKIGEPSSGNHSKPLGRKNRTRKIFIECLYLNLITQRRTNYCDTGIVGSCTRSFNGHGCTCTRVPIYTRRPRASIEVYRALNERRIRTTEWTEAANVPERTSVRGRSGGAACRSKRGRAHAYLRAVFGYEYPLRLVFHLFPLPAFVRFWWSFRGFYDLHNAAINSESRLLR